MPNRARNHAVASLPQPEIADLADRITALRERIVVMVYEGQQTRDQSEQLFRLLRALRAAKASGAATSAGLSLQALPKRSEPNWPAGRPQEAS